MCRGWGHTAEQCGTDSKALTVFDSKYSTEEEETDLAEIIAVEKTSGDSVKVGANDTKGMTELGYRMIDVVAEWEVVLRVDCALLAGDKDDTYDADRAGWKTYSHKLDGFSHTLCWDSGVTRHMCSTRKGMYEYKAWRV